MPSEYSGNQKPRRIPTPLYAAAGAGDLAYQQLRKLPERAAELRDRVGDLRVRVEDLREKVGGDLKVRAGDLKVRAGDLREKVAELRPAVAGKVSEQQLRADLDRLRSAARRNAAAFATGAQAAGERASVVYTNLVARGERVVSTVRAESAPAAEPSVVEPAVEPLAVEPAAEPLAVEPAVEPLAVEAVDAESVAAEPKPAKTPTKRTRTAK